MISTLWVSSATWRPAIGGCGLDFSATDAPDKKLPDDMIPNIEVVALSCTEFMVSLYILKCSPIRYT